MPHNGQSGSNAPFQIDGAPEMGWMMRGDMLHYLSELTAREAGGFGHTKAQRCHSGKEAAVR
jgi:hypothetical protein